MSGTAPPPSPCPSIYDPSLSPPSGRRHLGPDTRPHPLCCGPPPHLALHAPPSPEEHPGGEVNCGNPQGAPTPPASRGCSEPGVSQHWAPREPLRPGNWGPDTVWGGRCQAPPGRSRHAAEQRRTGLRGALGEAKGPAARGVGEALNCASPAPGSQARGQQGTQAGEPGSIQIPGKGVSGCAGQEPGTDLGPQKFHTWSLPSLGPT